MLFNPLTTRVLLLSRSSSVFLLTRYQAVSFVSPNDIDAINATTFKILMATSNDSETAPPPTAMCQRYIQTL